MTPTTTDGSTARAASYKTGLAALVFVLVAQHAAAFTCPFSAQPSLPSLKLVAGSGPTTVILVHEWKAERAGAFEDAACAGWSKFLNHLLTPDVEHLYSFYIFFHDTTKPVGFDGSGNAAELGRAIDTSSIPKTSPIGLIGHSRGGLVARAFLNMYQDGSYGERVFAVLTLGTPHRGSPLGVPDWALWSLREYRHDELQDCLLNLFYNNTTDPTIVCVYHPAKIPVPITASPQFNIFERGALDLAWDNADGPSRGIPYALNFTIKSQQPIAVGNVHTLSVLDGNVSGATMPVDEPDQDVHRSRESGSLADLNARERFRSRIIPYAGYLSDLTHNVVSVGKAISSTVAAADSEAIRLRFTAQLLAAIDSKDSTLGMFWASDGAVPVQSALFLAESAMSELPYETTTPKLCEGSNRDCSKDAIAFPLNLKTFASSAPSKRYRPLADFNHSQLRDGKDDDPKETDKLFESIRTDLADALAVFEVDTPVITSIQPRQLYAEAHDQAIQVVGSRFRPGLTMTVGLPGGVVVSLTGQQIVAVSSSSVTALVTFHDAGSYVLSVTNPDGEQSNAFPLTVSALSPSFVTALRPPQGLLGSPVAGRMSIDSADNLVVTEEFFGTGCGFGFCGTRLASFAPDGNVNWDVPSRESSAWPYLPYDANNWYGDAIFTGPDSRTYFENADNNLTAVDGDGHIANGWPIIAPYRLTGIVIDPSTHVVYGRAGASQGFFRFPFTIFARDPDGSLRWQFDQPDGNFSSGVIGSLFTLGPLKDIYTVTSANQIIRVNHSNGLEMCRGPAFGVGRVVGGDEGAFTASSNRLFRYDASCNAEVVLTQANRNMEVRRYVAGFVVGVDYLPNQSDRRLIGVHHDGVLKWFNDIIAPLGGSLTADVQAVNGSNVYVIGIDKRDGLRKLFGVHATNGVVVTAIPIGNLCSECEVTVASDGTVYLNDFLSSRPRITRIPPP